MYPILIVDDHEPMRDGLASILCKWQHLVYKIPDTAASVIEAYQKVQQKNMT